MLCWLRLQNAVTYDRVSSLFCRLAALPCELFSGLQSVDLVNILATFRACLAWNAVFAAPFFEGGPPSKNGASERKPSGTAQPLLSLCPVVIFVPGLDNTTALMLQFTRNKCKRHEIIIDSEKDDGYALGGSGARAL